MHASVTFHSLDSHEVIIFLTRRISVAHYCSRILFTRSKNLFWPSCYRLAVRSYTVFALRAWPRCLGISSATLHRITNGFACSTDLTNGNRAGLSRLDGGTQDVFFLFIHHIYVALMPMRHKRRRSKSRPFCRVTFCEGLQRLHDIDVTSLGREGMPKSSIVRIRFYQVISRTFCVLDKKWPGKPNRSGGSI